MKNMHKRDATYEFIRAVSMLLVISVHACSNAAGNYLADTFPGQLVGTVIFLCNGLFFMISGKFALGVSCQTMEDYKQYYLKRLGSIGIPTMVCMLLRSMFNIGWWPEYFLSADFLKEYIQNVLYNFASCEYWFLYRLAGFLAAAPFLGKMLQRMSKTEMMLLVGMGIVYNGLVNYLPLTGLSFGWSFPMGDWLVLFILGYVLERVVETEKEEKQLLILGGLTYCLCILLKRIGLTEGIHDMAPTYAVLCCAGFIALKKLYRSGRILDAVIIWLGRLTMPVYLMHMMVLYTILPYIPQWPAVLRWIALTAATLVMTLLVSYVLDRTVFAALLWLYRKITGLQPKTAGVC